MSSSPTPNAATWIPSWSATISRRYQLSVSLDERITLMEAFISTLSLTLDGELTYEINDSSMLTAATRTYNLAVEHRKRCSIMRSRMATWSPEDLIPTSEEKMFQEMALSGIQLRMQRLLTAFGNLFELAPRALLCNHQSLRAYADWHYRPPAVAYRHPCELRIVSDHVPELDYWVRDNLSGVGKSYTYGPARAASRCAGAQAATCSDGPLVRWFTSYTWASGG